MFYYPEMATKCSYAKTGRIDVVVESTTATSTKRNVNDFQEEGHSPISNEEKNTVVTVQEPS